MIFWSVAFAVLFAIIILEIIAFGMDLILLVLLGVEILWLMMMCFWYFIIPRIQYKALAIALGITCWILSFQGKSL